MILHLVILLRIPKKIQIEKNVKSHFFEVAYVEIFDFDCNSLFLLSFSLLCK